MTLENNNYNQLVAHLNKKFCDKLQDQLQAIRKQTIEECKKAIGYKAYNIVSPWHPEFKERQKGFLAGLKTAEAKIDAIIALSDNTVMGSSSDERSETGEGALVAQSSELSTRNTLLPTNTEDGEGK